MGGWPSWLGSGVGGRPAGLSRSSSSEGAAATGAADGGRAASLDVSRCELSRRLLLPEGQLRHREQEEGVAQVNHIYVCDPHGRCLSGLLQVLLLLLLLLQVPSGPAPNDEPRRDPRTSAPHHHHHRPLPSRPRCTSPGRPSRPFRSPSTTPSSSRGPNRPISRSPPTAASSSGSSTRSASSSAEVPSMLPSPPASGLALAHARPLLARSFI
jgi:hypothetical protein